MLDHSAEHLGRCSNETLALNQILELKAKKAVTLSSVDAKSEAPGLAETLF